MNKPLQWVKSNVLKATKTNCHYGKKYAEMIHKTAFLNNQRIIRRGQEMILDQHLISAFGENREKAIQNFKQRINIKTKLIEQLY
jgi:aromatic ring-opening dioxygenase LigB subunit